MSEKIVKKKVSKKEVVKKAVRPVVDVDEVEEVVEIDLSGEIAELESEIKHAKDDLQRKRIVQKSVALTEKIRNESPSQLLQFLRFKQVRKLIDKKESFELNELESESIEEKCECYNMAPTGLKAQVGGIYSYKKVFDEANQKYLFTVFVSEIIPGEAQIGRQLEQKMARGFMPVPEDYEPDKTIYHRFPLYESEFEKYFRVI